MEQSNAAALPMDEAHERLVCVKDHLLTSIQGKDGLIDVPIAVPVPGGPILMGDVLVPV